MEKWIADFEHAQRQLPCWFSRFLRPRLIFLPKWCPGPFGAWAYLQMAFIGPGLIDAPDDVRHYVVGHEYGHIYSKHTVLHLFFILGFTGYIFGWLTHITALCFLGYMVMAVVTCLALHTRSSHDREYEADDVAVLLYGKDVVLRGSLWTAAKAGTLADEFRKSRLLRLGWSEPVEQDCLLSQQENRLINQGYCNGHSSGKSDG